ncbi:SDR family oxidoreductase [Thermomonas sp. HDW16]|uniref:SDR family oxidoreductase n=1 Tax=Thermomonas sp. HDW16 TaxID=2714945 RepID=UPI00140C207B|nr:SDR family oxidoreductase [Thermomonas sp. HDW16]QIL21612.1 SDR family oxidoreductase [Thermomonas sp. HDW16]
MNNNEKIALVTGATRGIGTETVRQLAEAGVRVVLAGRDAGKAEAAATPLQAQGLPVESIALDVNDAASIDAAAKAIGERFGRLDILVNNAGIMIDDISKGVSGQGMDTWRTTFDTNLFGVVAVTKAFLPLLHKSQAGRIVNVSSALGSMALHADPASPIYHFKVPAYDVSKTAVNAWTVHLAYELRDSAIKVNTIHPGYVKTDMNAGEGDLDVADGARTSVRLALIDADGPNGGYFHLDQALPW